MHFRTQKRCQSHFLINVRKRWARRARPDRGMVRTQVFPSAPVTAAVGARLAHQGGTPLQTQRMTHGEGRGPRHADSDGLGGSRAKA